MAHWRDFQTLLEELNTALRVKGLVPFQLWEASFGRLNDALMVADYESLEAYEREHFALHADAECMELWREMGQAHRRDHVDRPVAEALEGRLAHLRRLWRDRKDAMNLTIALMIVAALLIAGGRIGHRWPVAIAGSSCSHRPVLVVLGAGS